MTDDTLTRRIIALEYRVDELSATVAHLAEQISELRERLERP